MLADGLTHFDGERIEKWVERVGWILVLACPALFWAWYVTDANVFSVLAVVAVLGGMFMVRYANLLVPPWGVDQKEGERGYTTNAHFHDPEVALVLPRSGIIVRYRGEEKFPVEEYERLARDEVRRMRRGADNARRSRTSTGAS